MRHSKKLAALAIAAGVAVTVSTAFAYWTTTGSGTGSASAESGDHAVTVTQVGSITGMYPGEAPHPINFEISNPGPSKQYMVSRTPDWRRVRTRSP